MTSRPTSPSYVRIFLHRHPENSAVGNRNFQQCSGLTVFNHKP